jgi:hypothetical protein
MYGIDNDSLRCTEKHLYGSSRLGLIEKHLYLNSATVNVNKPGSTGLVLGVKRNARRYELTNHLGNVLSVISDVKRPKTESSTEINVPMACICWERIKSPFIYSELKNIFKFIWLSNIYKYF